MLCPICGKDEEKLVDGICNSCYTKQNPLTFKDVDITVCVNCRTFFYRNKWTKFENLDEIFKRQLKKYNVNILNVDLPKHVQNGGVEVDGTVLVSANGVEYTVPVHIQYILCKKCGKIGTEYFEGTLQLRTVSQEVLSYVENDLIFQKGNGISCSKIVEHKLGNDYYMSSNKYIVKLGKNLKKKFGGEVLITRKLFSRSNETSKPIYRVTVLYKQNETFK